MTANEMADELELKADRVAAFGSPGYEDEDITSVLTEAEWLFIKKFIDNKNNRKGESLDETEVRSQGLSALIKQSAALTASSNQTGVFTNGTFFDLPNDFMYAIREDVTIDKTLCNNDTENIEADIYPVPHDKMKKWKDNKYHKPYYQSYGDAKVWRAIYSREIDGDNPAFPATAKRHELITDGTFNVSEYKLRYLRIPKGIIVDRDIPANQRNSILDESTHPVIIDIALSLLLERVKEQELSNIESFKDLE